MRISVVRFINLIFKITPMRVLFFFCSCLGLTLLPSCSRVIYDANVDHSIGTFSRSIEVEGKTREYIVYVPNTYDTIKSIPVMLNLHGWTCLLYTSPSPRD